MTGNPFIFVITTLKKYELRKKEEKEEKEKRVRKRGEREKEREESSLLCNIIGNLFNLNELLSTSFLQVTINEEIIIMVANYMLLQISNTNLIYCIIIVINSKYLLIILTYTDWECAAFCFCPETFSYVFFNLLNMLYFYTEQRLLDPSYLKSKTLKITKCFKYCFSPFTILFQSFK